jgi:hypothetical protein
VAGGVGHFSLATHLLLLKLALVHVARGPGEDALPILLVVEELALRGRKYNEYSQKNLSCRALKQIVRVC